MLGHVLSKEQSKDSSNRASDDGHLTIVQCHHYHRPFSLDLYRSSIGILPLLRYHQQNLHSYHCHYQHHVLSAAAQPEPHHAPHTFHVPGQSHCACTSSQGHELWSPQGFARIYISIFSHPPEYESPHYMFILLSYALQVNSLYVYVLLQYKYSSLLYVFH